MRVWVSALFFLGLATSVTAQSSDRVEKLIRELTLEEKIALLHGRGEPAATYQGQAGYLPGNARLGIQAVRLADGPPGVLTRIPSAALPGTMNVAATWSIEAAEAEGRLVANQARARGIGIALQPFINMDRDPQWTRAYNTFGEDPLLTAEMGAAQIRAIQGLGVMAQAKHFVGYDANIENTVIDEQTLHEVYLRPFAWAVRANVASLMCSYNRLNGVYACGNSTTLKGVLRDQFHFNGFVTSDWGAVHATDFLHAGLDMEMPGPLDVPFNGPSYFVNNPPVLGPKAAEKSEPPALSGFGALPEEPLPPKNDGYTDSPAGKTQTDLHALLANGSLSETDVDTAVRHVLTQLERFGYLDGKGLTAVEPHADVPDKDALLHLAEQSAVLLKNEDAVLPLATKGKKIAFIGPGARQIIPAGQLGEKATGLPALEEGPYSAFKRLAGSGVQTELAVANDMDGVTVPASALTHNGLPGLERRMWSENAVTIDPEVNFTTAGGNALHPDAAAVWNGTLTAPESGDYRIHLQLLGCWGKVVIDGQPVDSIWFNFIHGEITQPGADNLFPTTDGLDNVRATIHLTSGPHTIRVEANPDTSHAPAQIRLAWVTPTQQRQNFEQAIEAAKHADVAVVFAWARVRPAYGLPGDQNALIEAITRVNKNVVVVLNVGQPVEMPWLGGVKGVLLMGWPGDLGGVATARVLSGQYNPGGHLPYTWAKRLSDVASHDPKHPERGDKSNDRRTTYSEGLLLGYRWLDRQKIEPQFAFGFGLSYTTFQVSDAHLQSPSTDGVHVSVRVRNTGSREGSTVVQAYLAAPAQKPQGAEFADRILAGFSRVSLKGGESREVSLTIPSDVFRYWSSSEHQWQLPDGPRTLSVGTSSRDLPLQVEIGGAALKAIHYVE